MATILFKDINKIYDNNVQAVFDFNLEVKDKEFIVFVGPSGCGKTTTLRMVAGLEDITSGELYIDGRLINNVVPKDRDIAMVFQSYALYPQMTVYDNMAFALKLRKSYMPVYEQTETSELEIKNQQLFKELNKVDRAFKKKQDRDDLLQKHIELITQIIENDKLIKENKKQVIGIDHETIEANNKVIKTLTKDIEKATKLLDQLAQKYESGHLKGVSEEEYNNMRRVYDEALRQKNNQLERLKADNERLLNNEIPINSWRHLTKQEIAIDINQTAFALDLTRYLFRKPKALSGGQRQRVALGRAIVRKPKVFLMDEPLSNLDAKLRAQMRSEISKIHENVGGTTIYVTHDQIEAMTMATRIVIMKDGVIQQIGTPSEVYSNPSNKFVAGFIGSPSMNFLKCHVLKDKLLLKNGEEDYFIKLNKEQLKSLQDYIDKDIILGFRPEALCLDNDPLNPAPSKAIKTECYFSELLGNELLLHFKLFDTKIVSKTSCNANIKTHDTCKICFNIEGLYFFDVETENRIL